MNINSKMTALADEIRELSGTTTTKSIDTMTSDVNTANIEITEQTDLIEQIATALEGKTGGGSGEDVTEETTAYTTKLASLETAISALESELEGKASGGSGGSGGVQYEIITIPAGATSATYTLPAVTDVYGSVAHALFLSTLDGYDAIISVYTEAPSVWLRYMSDLSTLGENASCEITSENMYFSNGNITWYSGRVVEPLQLILVYDPSKTPVST